MVIAALCARAGTSKIDAAYQIDRGTNGSTSGVRALGARDPNALETS